MARPPRETRRRELPAGPGARRPRPGLPAGPNPAVPAASPPAARAPRPSPHVGGRRRPLQEDELPPGRHEKVSSACANRRALLRTPNLCASSSTRSAGSCASFPGAPLIGPPRGRGQPLWAGFPAGTFGDFHLQNALQMTTYVAKRIKRR